MKRKIKLGVNHTWKKYKQLILKKGDKKLIILMCFKAICLLTNWTIGCGCDHWCAGGCGYSSL